MDGGKRDRWVWLGDFYITATSIVVSTNEYDTYKGTIEQAFAFAAQSGAVGISNPIGLDADFAQANVGTNSLILSDYQLDLLNSIYLYYETYVVEPGKKRMALTLCLQDWRYRLRQTTLASDQSAGRVFDCVRQPRDPAVGAPKCLQRHHERHCVQQSICVHP